MIKKKKYQSKRMTVKKKHMIDKLKKNHNRKMKKEAKKNPHLNKKMKKDPGIPNLWPFKEEMLQQQQRQKEERKLEDKLKRESKKKNKTKEGELASMQFDAMQRANEFEQQQTLMSSLQEQNLTKKVMEKKLSSQRAYYREFKKVTEVADVLLEVLDARDPLGSRCPDIEKAILTQNPDKKIVLILNKIDMVPREVVEKWLVYLRREFPTLAFKCNTQQQKGNRKMRANFVPSSLNNKNQNDAMTDDDTTPSAKQKSLKSSDVVGADTLIQLLKNYCRSKNLKKAISVGIIGYPNVGKSSVINSLKRSKVVTTGNTPGVTKNAQEIHLDHNIKLLDCPGIIFSSGSAQADLILRNCIKVEQLDDPVAPVEAVLSRCKKEKLMELYNVGNFKDVYEFLQIIAQKTGKLRKGGEPDFERAARQVLADWNDGKIPFYTLPPVVHASAVDEFNARNNQMKLAGLEDGASDGFDLDDLIKQTENMAISQLPSLTTHADNFIPMMSTGYGTIQIFNDDDGDNAVVRDRKRKAETYLSDEDDSDSSASGDSDSDDDKMEDD